MPTEVCSPITRKGSNASGNIPGSSPGARSMPGASGGAGDSVPPQPSHGPASRHSAEPEPPLREPTKVVGPEN
jgi:hypothetical protein